MKQKARRKKVFNRGRAQKHRENSMSAALKRVDLSVFNFNESRFGQDLISNFPYPFV